MPRLAEVVESALSRIRPSKSLQASSVSNCKSQCDSTTTQRESHSAPEPGPGSENRFRFGCAKAGFLYPAFDKAGYKNLISKVGKALGVSEYSPSLSKFSKNPVIFQNFVSNLRFCIKNLNRI